MGRVRASCLWIELSRGGSLGISKLVCVAGALRGTGCAMLNDTEVSVTTLMFARLFVFDSFDFGVRNCLRSLRLGELRGALCRFAAFPMSMLFDAESSVEANGSGSANPNPRPRGV